MAHKTGAAFSGGHIIHGCANAMYLGKVIQFNARDERAKTRYAFIAKEILHLEGNTEDELVEALVQKIRDINDALDIPQGIKNYGEGGTKSETSIIDEKEFFEKAPEVARLAIEDACTLSNPRKPTQEEMERATAHFRVSWPSSLDTDMLMIVAPSFMAWFMREA